LKLLLQFRVKLYLEIVGNVTKTTIYDSGRNCIFSLVTGCIMVEMFQFCNSIVEISLEFSNTCIKSNSIESYGTFRYDLHHKIHGKLENYSISHCSV